MIVSLNESAVYIGTGGKAFDATLPTVVFLHGSGMDHRAWALQTRWFAFHGYNVLAPDFPGHSLSAGSPLTSIEDSAHWLGQLFDALEIKAAHIVGHSQGFLTALELAANAPERVLSLTGIGTAAAIPVNSALIETAQKSARQAALMMLQWGFGPKIHLGLSPIPGMQPIALGLQVMSNNPLAVDLACCAAYQGGAAACDVIAQLEPTLPVAMILGGNDKMTPIKAGRAAAVALNAQLHELTDAGHMLPVEAPREVLTVLRGFIAAQVN